jgi:hypothetical protein
MENHQTDTQFHPTLVGEIFSSNFCSIIFKSEIWLEEKYGKRYDLHRRKFPPWMGYNDFDKDYNPSGVWIEQMLDLENPMNWPCFVHSIDGLRRFIFNIDHLWDIHYRQRKFEYRTVGPEFGGGKGLFSLIEGTWNDLRGFVIGYLERTNYMVEINETEVEERWETGVYQEYYFNSMFGKDVLFGPIRIVNHDFKSGLVFKEKLVKLPVYSGINYWDIKISMKRGYRPEKYFFQCVDWPGVVLVHKCNTINIRKGQQIFCNYTGVKRLPNILDMDHPGKTKIHPANKDYEFPLERVDWKYPTNFAARGRLYFNTNAEDLDYVPHEEDPEEMWKDGCPGLEFPVEMENPIISFPGSPIRSEEDYQII